MRSLSKDRIMYRLTKKDIERFLKACEPLETSRKNEAVLLSIYIVETHFRKMMYRQGEYIIAFASAIVSVLFKRPMKNYTIGKCQLGIATICNYYGGCYYQHQRYILIRGIKALGNIFSITILENTVKILNYRVLPIIKRAEKIYPDNIELQMYYIGEQFNGRYSYGLLLYEVFELAYRDVNSRIILT